MLRRKVAGGRFRLSTESPKGILSLVKRTLLAASFLFLLVSGRAAWADDVQQDLNKEYVGKVLTLRHFYEGDHLRFLSDGNLVEISFKLY